MINLQTTLDAALALEVAPLNAQIAQLQADLAAAIVARDAAIASVGPLNAQVAALTAQVASLNAQVADLQAQLAALQVPVASQWNTGHRGGIANLTATSAVTANDVVIENKNIALFSGFVVTGLNFTLRNCVLNYSGAFGVDGQNGPITVENCSMRPAAGAGPSVRGTGLIRGNNVSINTTGAGGFHLLGVSTVRDNYLADIAAGANFTPFLGNLAGSTIVNNTVA